MRCKHAVLAAGMVVLGLTAQVRAAPAGFTEHKTGGVAIALPSEWQIAPKDFVAKLQKQAGSAKILLLAQGVGGEPKMTVMRQPQGGLTQAEFEKMDDVGIKKVCREFAEGNKNLHPEDFVCGREKADKGSALAARFAIPAQGSRPAMCMVNWVFYQGKSAVVANAMFKKDNAEKLLPRVEASLKSVRLTGK